MTGGGVDYGRLEDAKPDIGAMQLWIQGKRINGMSYGCLV
jgi:hypothetical protein